jgi:hypothetical protein
MDEQFLSCGGMGMAGVFDSAGAIQGSFWTDRVPSQCVTDAIVIASQHGTTAVSCFSGYIEVRDNTAEPVQSASVVVPLRDFGVPASRGPGVSLPIAVLADAIVVGLPSATVSGELNVGLLLTIPLVRQPALAISAALAWTTTAPPSVTPNGHFGQALAASGQVVATCREAPDPRCFIFAYDSNTQRLSEVTSLTTDDSSVITQWAGSMDLDCEANACLLAVAYVADNGVDLRHVAVVFRIDLGAPETSSRTSTYRSDEAVPARINSLSVVAKAGVLLLGLQAGSGAARVSLFSLQNDPLVEPQAVYVSGVDGDGFGHRVEAVPSTQLRRRRQAVADIDVAIAAPLSGTDRSGAVMLLEIDLDFGSLASTTTAVTTALDRINVARLVAFLRGRLEEIGKLFLFEPNDEITRNQIRNTVESLMIDLVAKRALFDYLVVCDLSNNTPARIDRNELYVDIAIEPVKAIEFIYIPLRIKNTGEISAGV